MVVPATRAVVQLRMTVTWEWLEQMSHVSTLNFSCSLQFIPRPVGLAGCCSELCRASERQNANAKQEKPAWNCGGTNHYPHCGVLKLPVFRCGMIWWRYILWDKASHQFSPACRHTLHELVPGVISKTCFMSQCQAFWCFYHVPSKQYHAICIPNCSRLRGFISTAPFL